MKRIDEVSWHDVQDSTMIIEVSADEVRNFIDKLDEDTDDVLITALDEQQGPVFSGEAEATYVLVKISRANVAPVEEAAADPVAEDDGEEREHDRD